MFPDAAVSELRVVPSPKLPRYGLFDVCSILVCILFVLSSLMMKEHPEHVSSI